MPRSGATGSWGARLLAAALLGWLGAMTMLCVPAAQAASGWTAPGLYPLPASASEPFTDVGFQSGGTATLAYLEVASTSPLQTVLHAGTIAPGAAYEEQLRTPSSSANTPVDLALREAPDGAAVLEWTALDGSDFANSPRSYFARYRAAGSASWGPVTTLASDQPNQPAANYQLVPAIATDGRAAAGVVIPGGTSSTMTYAMDVKTVTAAGSWSTPAGFGPSASNAGAKPGGGLAMAYDGEGNLTALYTVALGSSANAVGAQTLAAGHTQWGSMSNLTGGFVANSSPSSPMLAVAGDGSAIAAFRYSRTTTISSGGSTTTTTVNDANVVTRPGADGPWGTQPDDVTSGGTQSAPIALEVAPDDTAYMLYWQAQSGSSGANCVGVVRSNTPISADTPTFTTPNCISATDVVPSGGGIGFIGNDAYFAWSGNLTSSGSVLELANWAAGAPNSSDGSPIDNTGTLQLSGLTSDGAGSLVALWGDGSGAMLDSAFVAGGPLLISSQLPGRAYATRRLNLEATFFDLWSSLASGPTWSFGDGRTGQGITVSHRYAKRGIYHAAVSATDAFGNTTTRSFTVVVSNPPPPALESFRQSARKWTRAAGTWFRFKVTQPGRARFTFIHHGRVAGRVAVSAHTGRNRLHFQGRLSGGRRLRPGRYEVILQASDAGGSSRSRRLRFAILSG